GSYTWSISAGSLPAGLTLNTSTGAITGTPTTAGTSNFTAKVTDSNSRTATQNLSITVNAALSITTTSLPSGTVGTAYSSTLAATGGTGSYTWSISAGSLPAGLTLNTSTGAITGTPTTAGTSNFTAKVTDSNSRTATQNLSITINAALSGDFSMSASPGNLTLKNGQSGSYTVSVSPSGGFTGLVDLTVSGCPNNTTCTFLSSKVNITGTSGVSSQLAVANNGAARTSSTLTITGKSEANPNLMHSVSVNLRTR
ncbi:MAG TPA: Ig domain-containing protein, partial [Terriglobia bacterium]|nr:Ig domain-containing protein [Terriglobia bacterium]